MRLALHRSRGRRRRAVVMHRLNMLFHTRLAGCDELVLLQLRGAMLRRRAHRGRFVAVDWPRLQRLLFVQNILRLAMLIAARRPVVLRLPAIQRIRTGRRRRWLRLLEMVVARHHRLVVGLQPISILVIVVSGCPQILLPGQMRRLDLIANRPDSLCRLA